MELHPGKADCESTVNVVELLIKQQFPFYKTVIPIFLGTMVQLDSYTSSSILVHETS